MRWLNIEYLPVNSLGFRKASCLMKLPRALKIFLKRDINGKRFRNDSLVLQGPATMLEFFATAAGAGVISYWFHTFYP